MTDHRMIFDIIYAIAASNGREASLFGQTAPLAKIAFERSLASDAFPELWFELPLSGDPWFDLHALTARENLDPSTELLPEQTGGYPRIFEWFSRQGKVVRQLALSWDTGSGTADGPAVQLLVNTSNPHVTCEFLEVAGRPEAADSYRAFRDRIPQGWYACYIGVFPERAGADSAAKPSWTRVECIPDNALQRSYATDAALLEEHLHQTGLDELGDTVVPRCQALARTPFNLEFQFDIGPDGAAEATFGASVRFATPPGTEDWQPFDIDGAAGSLMEEVEEWGLADGRWRDLAGTIFAKRVARRGTERVIYCYPAFLKLRWRNGVPLDAKTYLIAGVESHRHDSSNSTSPQAPNEEA